MTWQLAPATQTTHGSALDEEPPELLEDEELDELRPDAPELLEDEEDEADETPDDPELEPDDEDDAAPPSAPWFPPPSVVAGSPLELPLPSPPDVDVQAMREDIPKTAAILLKRIDSPSRERTHAGGGPVHGP